MLECHPQGRQPLVHYTATLYDPAGLSYLDVYAAVVGVEIHDILAVVQAVTPLGFRTQANGQRPLAATMTLNTAMLVRENVWVVLIAAVEAKRFTQWMQRYTFIV